MVECSIHNCTEYSLFYKMGIMGLWGFFMKLYDDLDELYLCKNQRILAVLQTIQTLLLCFWCFVVANTKFDILVTVFFLGTFLLDWESFASDAYFFSIICLFPIVTIGILLVHTCSFTIKEYVLSFLLWCLSIPLPEFFCIKYNGFVTQISQFLGISPPSDGITIFKITETELEVSFYKLKIRIMSLFYLIACLCLLFYVKSYYSDRIWTQMISALIAFNSFFMVYICCSIFNQANVLYFHPEIVEIHKAKNND
jgi:hypothetical protein